MSTDRIFMSRAAAPLALAAAMTAGSIHPAHAAPPAVAAQSASMSAASNLITLQRLPLQIGTGAPTYFDVTVKLVGVVSGTTITGVHATATSQPSQFLDTGGFVAGTYKDFYGNSYTMTGPGVGAGGITVWTLTHVSGTAGCYLTGANWYTDGPSSPVYARVQTAKITQTTYSFGLLSSSSGCSGDYYPNALLGFAQDGHSLSLVSYTSGFTDSSQVLASQVLTLQ